MGSQGNWKQDSKILHEPSFQELKVRTRPVRVWLCPAQGGALGAFPFLSSRLALMEKCLIAQCASVSARAHEPSRASSLTTRGSTPDTGAWLPVNYKEAFRLVARKMGSVPLTYLLKCNASQSCIWSSTLPCLGEHSCDVSHRPCSSPLWNTLALCVSSVYNLKHSLCTHVCKHMYTRGRLRWWAFPLHT